MPASLLEILRSIPDHRRAEGKRFDLATVLLYAILGMVAGANSYRQMHEFIRIHLQRLNEAFGLRLPYSPSYTGVAVDPPRRRSDRVGGRVPPARFFDFDAAFVGRPGLVAIAIDGKTLRGSFDAFSDRKAAHMMSALRQADQIVLGHLMVEEKSNEIPAAPEFIEALGLKGCVFTLDAEHAQKNVRARDRLRQSSAHPGQGQSTEPAPQARTGSRRAKADRLGQEQEPQAATAGKPAN